MKDTVCESPGRKSFEGRYYAITMYDVHPDANHPFHGVDADAGRIAGVVCGVDVDFMIQHKGDHVMVMGQLGSRTAQIAVSETAGDRVFIGALGGGSVALSLSSGSLVGNTPRWRRIELMLDSVEKDTLSETYWPSFGGREFKIKVRMQQISALWQMPPAAQAAVLPILVECLNRAVAEVYDHARDADPIVFGVPFASAPLGRLKYR